MTLAGWIFMLGSTCAVLSLTGYCYYRVLGGSNRSDD